MDQALDNLLYCGFSQDKTRARPDSYVLVEHEDAHNDNKGNCDLWLARVIKASPSKGEVRVLYYATDASGHYTQWDDGAFDTIDDKFIVAVLDELPTCTAKALLSVVHERVCAPVWV